MIAINVVQISQMPVPVGNRHLKKKIKRTGSIPHALAGLSRASAAANAALDRPPAMRAADRITKV